MNGVDRINICVRIDTEVDRTDGIGGLGSTQQVCCRKNEFQAGSERRRAKSKYSYGCINYKIRGTWLLTTGYLFS